MIFLVCSANLSHIAGHSKERIFNLSRGVGHPFQWAKGSFETLSQELILKQLSTLKAIPPLKKPPSIFIQFIIYARQLLYTKPVTTKFKPRKGEGSCDKPLGSHKKLHKPKPKKHTSKSNRPQQCCQTPERGVISCGLDLALQSFLAPLTKTWPFTALLLPS